MGTKWVPNKEAAFRITLNNGAEYQITLRRTQSASVTCDRCEGEHAPDEVEDGLCVECTEAVALSARNPEDYPTEATV